jgi:hypothetical protein
MRSAFGIPVCPESANPNAPISGGNATASVCFVKRGQGWCGELYVNGFSISENIGSASPQACYRSLRGHARNLASSILKLTEAKGRRAT